MRVLTKFGPVRGRIENFKLQNKEKLQQIITRVFVGFLLECESLFSGLANTSMRCVIK